jgi:phosphohistidine phosphatase
MSRLLIIRHAPAGDRDEFAKTGKDDSERPLTSEGKAKMRRAARGLRALVPQIDLLASSPYVRAHQTAKIVAGAYGKLDIQLLKTLIPGGSRPEILRWLRSAPDDATVAIAGHETDLSELIAWLLTASPKPFLELKKGGACLISYDGTPPARPPAGRMEWVLTRGQLERIGAA